MIDVIDVIDTGKGDGVTSQHRFFSLFRACYQRQGVEMSVERLVFSHVGFVACRD